MTIGACATAGGMQALRNWADEPAWRASVYPTPDYVQSLATSTPVAEHVRWMPNFPAARSTGGSCWSC